jgi:hypothetical protein
MNEKNPFDGLLEKLKQQENWPMVYLFKFIIPNDNHKLALAQQLFGPEARVTINKSRTGKYLSISANEMMLSPEEVIDRYNRASNIEGLISL